MSQLPNYQITANPVSTFETYGEGAPAAPAAMPGTPAAPVVNPLLGKLANLSATAAGFFAEKERRQAIKDVKTGKILTPEQQLQIAQEARNGNALSVASLVEKGIMAPDENPYVQIGQKTAIANLNAEILADRLDQMVVSDFENDVDGIRTADNPRAAEATYLARILEGGDGGLNVDNSFKDDFYYTSAFERSFSRVRSAFHDTVNGMRIKRSREDHVAGVQSDIRRALITQPVDPSVPENIARPPVNTTAQVEEIIRSPQYRAAYGGDDLLQTSGLYLIELAKDGNLEALEALHDAKLTNGQNILDASDVVDAEYGLALSQIQGASRRRAQSVRALENGKLKEQFRSQMVEDMVTNSSSTPELLMMSGVIRFHPYKTDVIQVPGVDAETGEQIFQDISLSELQTEATEQAYVREFARLSNDPDTKALLDNGALDVVGLSVMAASSARDVAGGKVQQIDRFFTDGLRELDKGEEGDLSHVETMLKTFRGFRAGDTKLVGLYLTEEQELTLTMLDVMTTGIDTNRGGIPKLSVQDAVASIERVRSDPRRLQRSTNISTELRDKIGAVTSDPQIEDRLLRMVQISKALGIQEEDADIASALYERFVIKTDHSEIFAFGRSISQDQAENTFDSLMEYALDEDGLPEDGGRIVREIRQTIEMYPEEDLVISSDANNRNVYQLRHRTSGVVFQRFSMEAAEGEVLDIHIFREGKKAGEEGTMSLREAAGAVGDTVGEAVSPENNPLIRDIFGEDIGGTRMRTRFEEVSRPDGSTTLRLVPKRTLSQAVITEPMNTTALAADLTWSAVEGVGSDVVEVSRDALRGWGESFRNWSKGVQDWVEGYVGGLRDWQNGVSTKFEASGNRYRAALEKQRAAQKAAAKERQDKRRQAELDAIRRYLEEVKGNKSGDNK